MQRIKGSKTAVILEDHQHERLEQIAKKFGIKKAQAHRLILETGLDAYSAFEGMGLVKLAELTKKTREALAKKRQLSLI